jgi:hypothetical protein
MKKIFALMLICIVSVFAKEHDMIEYIVKNNTNKLDINIPNNHTGIVIKNLGDNKSIIAIAKVNNGSIEYLENNLLEQEYLPRVIETPQAGDKIIFNYLYKNAVVIAPDYKTYKKVMSKYPNTLFVDIDTFSGFLVREAQPVPTKELFKKYAREYDVGLFYIAVDGRLFTVDAKTLDTISTRNFRVSTKNQQTPFYSRVKEIPVSLLQFSDRSVKDYTSYFKEFLGK